MQPLLQTYALRKEAIEKRLEDFEKFKDRSDEEIFPEMAFCLLTPQSSARSCWAAVQELQRKELLFSDNVKKIEEVLQSKTRFHETKATYIPLARKMFFDEMSIKEKLKEQDTKEMREWLVKNVKGFGYKEASHFLRNVGYGEDIAILDRHILKNLKKYDVIDEIPKSMTPKRYKEIEEKMKKFCQGVGIPMSHLDLLFWSEEAGEIFK